MLGDDFPLPNNIYLDGFVMVNNITVENESTEIAINESTSMTSKKK